MTMKDGIKLGIGFMLVRILCNGTASVLEYFVYPKLYREVKKTNPKFAEYMNRVCPCEEIDDRSPSELKAKIGFEF